MRCRAPSQDAERIDPEVEIEQARVIVLDSRRARTHSVHKPAFSATVARLIVQGAQSERGPKPPRYVGAGEGPSDLGRAAERYLHEIVTAR